MIARVVPAVGTGRARLLVERNLMVYRRTWLVLVSGFFEPLFYLLAIGVGIGALVGQVTGPDGHPISYTAFVAPALLASSAMNGAVFDSTFNIFFKLKHAKIYDSILATPVGAGDVALGEMTWALLRGLLYSVAFLTVMLAMGLVHSVWAVLALPAAALIGFAFASVGLAATSLIRSWQDFEFVQLALLPMFLFSTTFYPLSTYPRPLQIAVECTPLFHGVGLLRALTTGTVGWSLIGHAAYLAVMGLVGITIAARRFERLLLT
ncbi:MAG TPA: ABC transporter permease [Mycobacteriales bacterium]|nr:ABC transporter permease [Mycobacteriales bacterium]